MTKTGDEGQDPKGGEGAGGGTGGAQDGGAQDPKGGASGGGTGAGAGNEGGGSGGDDKNAGDGQKFDAAYVKELRDENAGHRKKLREVEKQLKELQDRDLSEQEKDRKRLQELTEENTALLRRVRTGEVFEAATKAGASRPEVVARLVEDDVEDLAAEMARMRKQYPELFTGARGSADAGGGDPPPKKGDMNDFIRKAAGR